MRAQHPACVIGVGRKQRQRSVSKSRSVVLKELFFRRVEIISRRENSSWFVSRRDRCNRSVPFVVIGHFDVRLEVRIGKRLAAHVDLRVETFLRLAHACVRFIFI